MKLSTTQELGIEVPHIVINRTSLEVLPQASEQDLARLEGMLEAVGGSALWWWGDYLNHLAGTRGVEYADAKAARSYSPQALRDASWVCRHVDVSRRRDGLTYSHHREVAQLSPTDQEVWLGKTEDNEWSHKQLRAEIRQSKASVKNGADQAPVDQRAARASEGWEVFAMWYKGESPRFTTAQREEWDKALEPLAADYLARIADEDLERLLAARDAWQEAQC